jgi:hypothetical protein
VTDAGENAQLSVVGKPEHVSATGLLKVGSGVTVTVIVPAVPAAIFIEAGLAANFRPAALDELPQLRLNFTAPDI